MEFIPFYWGFAFYCKWFQFVINSNMWLFEYLDLGYWHVYNFGPIELSIPINEYEDGTPV